MGGVGLLILVWVTWDVIQSIRSHRQPPSGGPPDDSSGAVGAHAVVSRGTLAAALEERKGTAADTD